MTNLNSLFPEAVEMTRFMIVVILLVLSAVGVDLLFGLIKAKLRGEVRSSWGLKRTAVKVLLYVGVILVLGFVDYLIHICHFYRMFGWEDLIGIPLLASIIGIFFLMVEIKSMFETADEKTKTEISRGGQLIKSIAENHEAIVKLTDIVEKISKLESIKAKEAV